MTPEEREAAKSVLARWQAETEAIEAGNALGWTLECFDPESATRTLYGIYLDPVEACREADVWQTELNQESGAGDPYVVTVKQINPPP